LPHTKVAKLLPSSRNYRPPRNCVERPYRRSGASPNRQSVGHAKDTAKARAAYQHFLTLWKDADPDIPILRQATAEYKKLTAIASTSASVSGRQTKEEEWLPGLDSNYQPFG
jgi:hypothetical protein